MRLKAFRSAKPWMVTLLGVVAGVSFAAADTSYDPSRYMSPREIRPGMTGYGRTVMSGTRIDTFEFEVVSVMSNAFYARQDVILVRCSGLKLEHSGIIGGMSGSPCYIRGEDGKDRMIGAVAYGWSFNKDPICGVQPITQMLEVAKFRDPETASTTRPASGAAARAARGADQSTARLARGSVEIGELIARTWPKPIDEGSIFSVFNDEIVKYATQPPRVDGLAGLQPLRTPVMIGGAGHPEVMSFLRDVFGRLSMEPVASGGPSASTRAETDEVKMEPGSVLCIPLITGDISADALGTCTEVIGDRVLGFGHSMDARGTTKLPLATGMVHTVIPSVMRSNKLGASLRTVGTLYGDEACGIFGVTGDRAAMVPVEVTVEDRRGKSTFRYEVAQDEAMTASLAGSVVMESIYAHSDLPREHTIKYSVETEFEGLGKFRTDNTTSQSGGSDVAMAAMVPAMTMLNSPFGEAAVKKVSVELAIEEAAKQAQIDEIRLDRQAYKPGETVTARVRWAHYRKSPMFTEESYTFDLPEDLPDGQYHLTVGGARLHMLALRSEKPHLFRAESLPELLGRLNQISAEPDNRLFLRLTLPSKGLAVKSTELPDLPSHVAAIYGGSRRTDIQPFQEALVKHYDLPFAAEGGRSLPITVSRRADQ